MMSRIKPDRSSPRPAYLIPFKVNKIFVYEISVCQFFYLILYCQNQFNSLKMNRTTESLKPDCYYHVYNRAHGDERLFIIDNNYLFFLQRYYKYLHQFLDTLCYCLMPNRFHFLIRVKSVNQIDLTELTKPDSDNFEKEIYISMMISRQFSNFFNSYSKSFNKQYHRKGSLFMRPYKRIRVSDETFLRKLVHYIHYNPIAAGLTEDYSWRYSSYPAIISTQKTNVCRDEVIDLFDDLDNFKYIHEVPPKISGIEKW